MLRAGPSFDRGPREDAREDGCDRLDTPLFWGLHPAVTGAAARGRAMTVVRDIAWPIPETWRGSVGARAPEEHVHARLAGPDEAAPVVAVLGGISATRHVADEGAQPRNAGASGPRPEREPGGERRPAPWWPQTAGPGCAIDTRRVRVMGLDFTPETPREPIAITPSDQAELLARAMDAAGVDRLHALVGASYGGMVGLAFARRFPDRLERLAVISAAHRPHPMGTGWRGVQRRMIAFAAEVGRPADGVALARQLAMTTYRSYEEFNQRFRPGLAGDNDTADVCGYLIARGEAKAADTSAARYISLSAAIDRHAEDPGAISTPTLIIAVSSDLLTPVSDMETLRDGLRGPTRYVLIDSLYGHDAFLKEHAALDGPLRSFLDEPLAQLSVAASSRA